MFSQSENKKKESFAHKNGTKDSWYHPNSEQKSSLIHAHNGAHRRGLIGQEFGPPRTSVPTGVSFTCLFFPNTIRLPSPPCRRVSHQPTRLFADKSRYSSVRNVTRVFYHKFSILSIIFQNLYYFRFICENIAKALDIFRDF